MPGFNYEAPPTQHKMNPYDITGAEVLKYIDFAVIYNLIIESV